MAHGYDYNPTLQSIMSSDPEAPFWMVWNPERNAPTHRHATQQEAVQEAERLARQCPSQRFYVLEAKGSCTFSPLPPVQWTKVDADWIPF